MEHAKPLIEAIEATAERLGISPSTVGERVGQGGRFYARLKDGKRVWPETEQKVRERLVHLEASIAGSDAADGFLPPTTIRPESTSDKLGNPDRGATQ